MIALPLSDIVFGYGAAAETYEDFADLAGRSSAPGLVFFTVHYLMLRGFYALERTRTVFWVQCVIADRQRRARRASSSAAVDARRTPRPAWSWPTAAPTRSARSPPTSCCGGCWARSRPARLVRFVVRMLIAAGLAGAAA